MRLSCHDFVDNQVRLQLFALAYNGELPASIGIACWRETLVDDDTSRENRRGRQNEDEGRRNLWDCDGRKPRMPLFHAPSLGMLCKITDDVRRWSFVWEIPS
jgi:hypothetical protein